MLFAVVAKRILMSVGFIRRYLVERELHRIDLENLKNELKVEFALRNQYDWGTDSFYLENPDKFRMTQKLGILEELPTARACRIFLYGEDIDETIEGYVPAPVQMPNSISVSENADGSYNIKVVQGEKFVFFSPFEPAFNYDNTKFLWNGIVYTIPQEYYGKPLDNFTIKQIERDISDMQNRMLRELEDDV